VNRKTRGNDWRKFNGINDPSLDFSPLRGEVL